MFQSLVAGLINIYDMWRIGNVALNDMLSRCVSEVQAIIVKICELVGQNGNFAKAHDLSHIMRDIELYGSSLGYSSGKYL